MKFTQQHKDTALNIAIAIAVVVGIYYLYNWLKNHISGDFRNHGGKLFGGSASQPSAGTVAEKVEGAFNNAILKPSHDMVVAVQLAMANKAAVKYRNKPGTDIVINKALKATLDLPDSEFLKVIKSWLAIDNLNNIYDSDLAGAKITASTRSAFLTRYGQLVSGANSDVLYMAHKVAPNT